MWKNLSFVYPKKHWGKTIGGAWRESKIHKNPKKKKQSHQFLAFYLQNEKGKKQTNKRMTHKRKRTKGERES